MIDGSNVDGKWSGKKMEGEDGLRTVECLRGRLLAERVASRVARQDAHQMGNKLIELERQLRVEIKSRNRAEKKLKLLLKKLESLNISCVSEESEHSSLLERSKISSVSSTASSSRTKEPEDKDPKTQISNPKKCGIEESVVQKRNCPVVFQDSEEEDVSQTIPASNRSPIEESFSSADKPCSEEHSEAEWSGNCNDPKTDDHSSSRLSSSVEKEDIDGRNNDQAKDDYVDNSLALVPIDLPKATQQPTEPLIDYANVKDVLQALRHAREKLLCSMERRHIINVGSK